MERKNGGSYLRENTNGYIVDKRIRTEVTMRWPKNIRIISSTLVFCTICALSTISVTVYLGVENYKRLHEYQDLRSQIQHLRWNMKRNTSVEEKLVNSMNYVTSEMTSSPLQPSPLGVPSKGLRNLTTEKRVSKPQKLTLKKNHEPVKKTSSVSRSETLLLFENEDSVLNLNSRVRRCLVRIENVEQRQIDFGNAQEFLRQQMHRRLASIESAVLDKRTLPSFSAYNSGDVMDGNDAITRFDVVVLNEGSGYDSYTGNFVCPLKGTYVFIVSIFALPTAYDVGLTSSYYTCSANLRKNGQIAGRAKSTGTYINSEDYYDVTDPRGVGLFMSLVVRLMNRDVIHASLDSECVLGGNGTSMFQGFYLHG